MEIDVVSTLSHPRPAVFAAMRDQMVALAAYMPNIDQITVESRDDSTPGEVRLVNRWQAARSEVPAVAPFVDPSRACSGWITPGGSRRSGCSGGSDGLHGRAHLVQRRDDLPRGGGGTETRIKTAPHPRSQGLPPRLPAQEGPARHRDLRPRHGEAQLPAHFRCRERLPGEQKEQA
ncbi:MAG: hypothetical protein R3F43_01780 [bacterium]